MLFEGGLGLGLGLPQMEHRRRALLLRMLLLLLCHVFRMTSSMTWKRKFEAER